MPVSSIPGPFSNSAMQGQIGLDYTYAAMEIQIELQDQLDVHGMGLVPLVGDVAGSGSDVLRVTDLGNVGFSLPMVALASETDNVVPSPINLGYETVTIAQFGLAQSETYFAQAIGRDSSVNINSLKSLMVQSWMRTFRDQVALTGSAFGTVVGSTATQLSVDDHLDLATEYRTNLGSVRPWAMIDGTQLDQLIRSYRVEPAFQNSTMDFSSMLGLRDGMPQGKITQHIPQLAGMGIDFVITDSVVQSGGGRLGFSTPVGGIGWGVARTSPDRITPANSVGALYAPDFGLLIEELTVGGGQTTREARATAFIGFAAGSARVHVQRRFVSII